MVSASLERAVERLRSSDRVVALTGAGISTDSGIPDFRGPQGLWTKNPAAERASHIDHYLGDPEVRRAAWQQRLHAPVWDAEPNVGHRSLVDLERSGRLRALITQNIDGLHQAAGSDPDVVIEVHGTARYTRCWECGDRRTMAEILDRVRAGEDDPACTECGGIIKSDTISFGQMVDLDVIDRAMHAAREADVLIAIGSTLSVSPVNSCVAIARRAGAEVVIVNGGPTEMDRYADELLFGEISEILPELVAQSLVSSDSDLRQS